MSLIVSEVDYLTWDESQIWLGISWGILLVSVPSLFLHKFGLKFFWVEILKVFEG